MAKLFRDPATNAYYTESELDGSVVTLLISGEAGEYLQQNGVTEGEDIPIDLLGTLADNGWLREFVEEDSWEEDAPAFDGNTSETGAAPGNERAVYDEPLPSVKLEPRPYVEPEDFARVKEEGNTALAENEQPVQKSGYSPDKANRNAMEHPEAAAFVGNVWFWVLVVIVIAIVIWGAIEIF